MQALEAAMLETTAVWEHEGVATGKRREISGAVDETFLQRLMVVCRDLVSGSLVCEEVAEDRTSDTWHTLAAARLQRVGSGVLSLVSDRAQALIKLAETGLGCLRIPDLFHRMHELVTRSAWAMLGRLRHARQALRHAQERLRASEASHPSGAEAQQAQAVVEASAAAVQRWDSVPSVSRQHLETRSLLVHPWRLGDSRRQTSAAVARQLHVAIQAIDVLAETKGLPVKKTAVDKVRTQRSGLCALVDLWWQGGWHDGQHLVLTPLGRRGIAEVVLPLRSWQQHVARTRCPRRKAKMLQALQAIHAACETHPIPRQVTPAILANGQTWAAERAKTLHRASAAVEGRHGSLSQMHHHHRGVPKRRDRVWTV